MSNDAWKKENTRLIAFRLFYSKHQDVIDWIDKQPLKADYLARIVREDMERQKAKENEAE